MPKYIYSEPEIEVLYIIPESVISASCLENPDKGDEWGWN